MGFSYSFRMQNVVFVYVTDIKQSRMVIPNEIEFLMYKNNGKFFRKFSSFMEEKKHCTKMTRIYFIYNLRQEDKISAKVKKYERGHIMARLMTEYQFTYCILTGNEWWMSVIGKQIEEEARELKDELKVIGIPQLANLLGEVIDNDGDKILIKERRKDLKIFESEDFKEYEHSNSIKNNYYKVNIYSKMD